MPEKTATVSFLTLYLRKVLGIKEANFIVLSKISWFKVVTSQLEMALEVTILICYEFLKCEVLDLILKLKVENTVSTFEMDSH